ncbi:sigma-54-dependent Fis family transcriptional regulator, partial [Acinetobacter baumannii]
VETIAPSSASVIIQGESGTGKELIAREIHLKSDRKNKPFLAVNCGALVETLAESELFGYEAGAFTGANKTRAGIFETADGGTLFLDEVGELPLSLQVKLLRVLQEKEVVRVGGRKPIPINVRILSGTHVDLRKAVAENKFRLDLYYRLNVVVLNILPLRERKGDILPLVDFFLSSYSQKLITTKPNISDRARNALLNYSWPGNIRELENNIHYALLVSGGKTIDLEHLRFSEETGSAVLPDNDLIQEFESILKRLFQEYDGEAWHIIEDKIVNTAFSSCWNNQVKTAKMLGLSRNVLRNLLSRYNLLPNKNENEIA